MPLRTSIAAAIVLALPKAANAQEGGKWTVYGQLSFGALTVENGGGDETFFAENGHIPSRIGATFAVPHDHGAGLAFNVETGFGLSDLSEAAPKQRGPDIDLDRTALRKFEAIYSSPSIGVFSAGQGSMASDGAAGVDLSGTSFAHGPAIGDLGGGVAFLDLNGEASGVFVGDVFDDLDGPRRFRVRYDAPEWNGLTASVAVGREVLREGDDRVFRDIAVAYARATDLFEAEAKVSYEWAGDDAEILLASASALHKPTGLNLTVVAGGNLVGVGDYLYVKLGLRREVFPAGRTAIALEYYDGDDLGFVGSDARAYGIGLAQIIDDASVEIVGALRRYELSARGRAFQNIDVAMIGARWRF
ncbi:MAG: hypothetical protein AAFN79_11305 [Pseudomonadota bacterium]